MERENRLAEETHVPQERYIYSGTLTIQFVHLKVAYISCKVFLFFRNTASKRFPSMLQTAIEKCSPVAGAIKNIFLSCVRMHSKKRFPSPVADCIQKHSCLLLQSETKMLSSPAAV